MSDERGRFAMAGPGADLHRRVDRIVVAVIVLARFTVLAMVAFSAAAGVQTRAYTDPPLAAGAYVLVAGGGIAVAVLLLRAASVPGWVLAADMTAVCAAVLVLPLAVNARYFFAVSNSDFEPVIVSVAVAVALATASGRRTAVACAALAAAYVAGQAPLAGTLPEVSSMLAPILWMVATAACACVFVRRLRQMADAVDTANGQVLAQREQLAAERAAADARQRHFREQVRRHRALHDGPLRTLTTLAGPGPLGHPHEQARRLCAIAANVLRGITPDDPRGTLTDLSLALVEAGGESAAAGLRVEYHFSGLPDELPGPVVRAFAAAGAEALSNVATHAGTTRARLTALGRRPTADQVVVTVAVVDQGKGFDPATTEPGYGIRYSILARMRDAGGDAALDSHPGQGTRVDLRWPA